MRLLTSRQRTGKAYQLLQEIRTSQRFAGRLIHSLGCQQAVIVLVLTAMSSFILFGVIRSPS